VVETSDPADFLPPYVRRSGIAKASLGWDWKVCAAAVFLWGFAVTTPGAKPPSYEFIKKAFRDWVRRHPTRA
jgi:hypothetical protein